MKYRSNISKPVRLTSMSRYSSYSNISHYNGSVLLDYPFVRFSDAQVGGFLSLDPLAGERPDFSPYNYVSCNPISRVDPTGMIDDTYSVDGEGNITKIDDKKYYDDNGNEVDLLVRGRNVRYDRSGNVKNEHIYLKAGYLREGTKEKAFQVGGHTYKYSHLSFGADESESTRAFEFLAENTEVEWSLVQTKLFSKTNNELFTSHIWNEELAAPSLLMADPDKLKSLISDIHSHPPTHKMSDESRLRPSDEDKNFAKRVRQTNPGAIMKIYFNGQYMQY